MKYVRGELRNYCQCVKRATPHAIMVDYNTVVDVDVVLLCARFIFCPMTLQIIKSMELESFTQDLSIISCYLVIFSKGGYSQFNNVPNVATMFEREFCREDFFLKPVLISFWFKYFASTTATITPSILVFLVLSCFWPVVLSSFCLGFTLRS